MKKLSILLAFAILLTAVNSQAGEIDSGLENILNSTPADQTVSVLVYLTDQVDLSAITDQMDARKATLKERHEVVVRSLQDIALNSQGAIIDYLENMRSSGKIEDFHTYWVANCIRVDATKNEIGKIAARPDVEKVYFNYEIELIEPAEVGETDSGGSRSVEIGLEAVRAPEVWELGFDGAGVLVSNMDTGVDGDHPALADRWAGVADPRYDGHPEWAWYDPYNNQNDFPYDNHGHGTHTIGSVTGASETTGDTVGVAPGAFWISAAPIDRGGGIPRTVADAILSFEWFVDPDGNPETNWDVPDVMSNSWGVTTGHGYPPCDTLFWSYLDACEAAGTVVLFSAGNEGYSGLRRPADRATDDYRTCAVAAVDANQSGWPIASFSSRGPTYCTPDGSAAIKPDIAAPGVDVRSCYPGGGYASLSGTSMASPHVNGVVALVRQANPNLSVELVKQIIYDTAYDLGDPGEDNSYGWGMIDAYEAVQLALSYLEGYGMITGRVTDEVTGDGLQGRVIVTNRDPEIIGYCNQEGYYNLYVPSDTLWELRAEYTNDYLPDFASVMVSEDDTVYQDFVLEPKVEVVLMAQFGNPEDIAYRTFYFRGSWDDDGFYNPDWPSSFSPMRDDGVAPDEIEGDGIFTGSILLATDLNNTYSWAVYSENYNDHESRLQYGADFDITNPGNPPDVPVLAVNPSGNENNWTLTAYETGSGLEGDLMPGYNGEPHIWYASTFMPGGLEVNYIIKVMHSEAASYGEGGVGGPAISFTPPVSGVYTVYFNDDIDLASTGATLEVVPGWYEVDATADESVVRELTLRNTGEADLYFGISEEVDDYLGTVIDNPAPVELSSYEYHGPKPYVGDEPVNTPVLTGQGGPDDYGHTWIDSDEPGGPPVDWVDITDVGTPLNMSDDDNEGPFNLPFTFNFYGNDFTSFRVCSNGFISFTSTSTEYSNDPIPGNDPENLVAPMWDDFNPYNGGEVYYYITNDSAVVAWVDVPHYYNEGSYTFEVVLLRSGQIYFNYLDLQGDLNSATVGIQNDTMTDALQIVYNASYLHSNLSIKISAGWIDVLPTSGTIPPGGEEILDVTFDASNLALGDYTGRIFVTAWDDIRPLPQVEIPVLMHVVESVPALELAMQPDEVPVVVPPGGNFDYGISVTNNGGADDSYDGWLMLTLPDNNMVGPLEQVNNVPIAAGESQYFDLVQNVPNFAPLGNYTYHSRIGDYPGTIEDEATFPFEVQGGVAGTASEWLVEGFDVENLRREPAGQELPTNYSLSQNYPNPFNAKSVINYALPQSGNVDLSVYNLLGRKVTTLVRGHQQAGYHSVSWDAINYASGVYFYKLTVGDRSITKRMTLLK
ncbi:MAG: S8 family serine peptidase [candidate division Zixibacteria bacterium]|nr:S8 family serine peptidase [candidate division Zixibacteria bacterium]